MLGIGISVSSADFVTAAREKKLIVIPGGAETIRFYPPLIVEKEMIEGLISSLDKILSEGMSA